MTDTKEMIADAALKIIFDPRVKKLTVTNIVEECQITRQAFYYHFASIPALIEWIMVSRESEIEKLFESAQRMEDKIKQLFLFADSVKPYLEKSLSTGYHDEMMGVIHKAVSSFVRLQGSKNEDFMALPQSEQEIYIKIYTYVIFGFIYSWNSENAKSKDKICEVLAKVSDQLFIADAI